MFDNTTPEQYSLLDDFPSVTPVWRPFVQRTADTSRIAQEAKREQAECSE